MIHRYGSFEELAYYNGLEEKFAEHERVLVLVDESAFRDIPVDFFQNPKGWYQLAITNTTVGETQRELRDLAERQSPSYKGKKQLLHELSRVYAPNITPFNDDITNAIKQAHPTIPSKNARKKHRGMLEGELGVVDTDQLLYTLHRGCDELPTVMLTNDWGIRATHAQLQRLPRTERVASYSIACPTFAVPNVPQYAELVEA